MKALGFISSCSILIPLIAGLLFNRKHLKYQWYFLYFIAFSAEVESVMVYAATHRIWNLGIIHFFILIEFFFFSWLYGWYLNPVKKLKYVIIACALVVIQIELYLAFNNQLNELYGPLIGGLYTYFIALSGYYMLCLLDRPLAGPLNRQPDFWISLGIFIYFLMTIAVYASNKYFINGSEIKAINTTFAIINSLGNILGNLIFAYSFLCNKRVTQVSTTY